MTFKKELKKALHKTTREAARIMVQTGCVVQDLTDLGAVEKLGMKIEQIAAKSMAQSKESLHELVKQENREQVTITENQSQVVAQASTSSSSSNVESSISGIVELSDSETEEEPITKDKGKIVDETSTETFFRELEEEQESFPSILLQQNLQLTKRVEELEKQLHDVGASSSSCRPFPL